MIDGATLNAAERLFGVRYTDAERAQMRDNLGEQVQQVFRRRAVKLPHALSPATLFDPRLPGFAMPAQSAMNIPRIAPTLPQADEEIALAREAPVRLDRRRTTQFSQAHPHIPRPHPSIRPDPVQLRDRDR